MVPSKITILSDTREKYPLLFPVHIRISGSTGAVKVVRVEVEQSVMPIGDYAIKGKEHLCTVERKGSARELAGNFLSMDRRRALNAFKRLKAHCEHPFVLLDISASDIMEDVSGFCGEGVVASVLLLELRQLGIPFFGFGPCKGNGIRRHLGAFVAHLLVEYSYE